VLMSPLPRRLRGYIGTANHHLHASPVESCLRISFKAPTPFACLLHFVQCWAFSACVSLITAITTFMQHCHELPTDWEMQDLLQQGGPSSAAAQAALRQMTAAAAADSTANR
jgi:hypothetical protein